MGIRNCSAALVPTAAASMEKVWGRDCVILPTYAMTESCPIASNPRYGLRSLRSVGLPAGPKVRLLDEMSQDVRQGAEGEICVKGPNVTQGYEYRNHMDADPNIDAFTGDGWLRTGDKGYVDLNGYLCLTGRFKEIINRGGENFSPFEMEDMLRQHPSVRDIICFSAPHVQLGECVAIAVVLKDGAAAMSLSDFRCFLEIDGRLQQKWLPECLVLVSETPKGPTGKPTRINLADRYKLKPLDAEFPGQYSMWDARDEKVPALPGASILVACDSSLAEQPS